MRQVDFPWRLSWNVTQEDWYFKYPIFVHGCTLIYQFIEIRTTQLKEKWHMLFLCFAVHGGSKSFLILLGSTIPSRIHNHTHDTYSLLHVYPLHIKIGKILRFVKYIGREKVLAKIYDTQMTTKCRRWCSRQLSHSIRCICAFVLMWKIGFHFKGIYLVVVMISKFHLKTHVGLYSFSIQLM